jgi:hypothetical protein
MSTPDPLWGPIEISRWAAVPATVGRVATEPDVKAGRAVFYLKNPEEIGAEPLALALPCCAILKTEKEGSPVVIIQAEKAEPKKYIGYRDLVGGNGICTLEEVEILDGPDARFYLSQK